MTTLAERLRWVLDHQHAPNGDPWTPKALSRAAGLGESHVGQIASGTVTDPRGTTLEKIARAAGVSHAWLASGAGVPVESERDDHAHPPAPPSDGYDEPRFGALPNWPQLLAGARRKAPDVAEWAWALLPTARPMATSVPTVEMVAEAVRFIERFGTPPAGAVKRR
jgi:transcriptional regulator with XRE-family HTH domain